MTTKLIFSNTFIIDSYFNLTSVLQHSGASHVDPDFDFACLHVLHLFMWVSTGYSGFIPSLKNMPLSGITARCVHGLVLDGMPVQHPKLWIHCYLDHDKASTTDQLVLFISYILLLVQK